MAGSVSRIAFPLLLILCSAQLLHGQTDSTRQDSAKSQSSTEESSSTGRINPSVYWLPNGDAAGMPIELKGGTFDARMLPPPSAPNAAVLGVTVGGAQDIGYARQLIEKGKVPTFIDFSPEGLFSEHDIPTPESTCEEKLCLSLGYGFAPAADTKEPALFVHLGMASGIRPEEFKRPHLQLALVIDGSGSMRESGMDAVKSALRTLVDRLGPEDMVTLIAFNDSARLLLGPTQGNEREKILGAIERLEASGGTNIEDGLQLGFSLLDRMETIDGHQKRAMLFTDAKPTVGETDSASFRRLTQRYADRGIGLTAFGVGLDFGQELIYHITSLRGGSFYFLQTPEKIAKIFENEFDYLVTPVVYDLDVKIRTPKGLKLTAVYGLPTWKPGNDDAELHIPTLFFSSNRGAIVLRYERDGTSQLSFRQGDLLADGSLSYTDVDGSRTTTRTALRHDAKMRLSPGMQFYTHEGMRMAVALTNLYFGLRDGCLLNTEGKKEKALEAVRRAQTMVDLENLTLVDAGLERDVALLEQLALNIEANGRDRQTREADPEKEAAIQD